MKEIKAAWRKAKGPVWAAWNGAKASVKTELIDKYKARKRRGPVVRHILHAWLCVHAVGVGVAVATVCAAAFAVAFVLTPVLGLWVGGMYWVAAGSVE